MSGSRIAVVALTLAFAAAVVVGVWSLFLGGNALILVPALALATALVWSSRRPVVWAAVLITFAIAAIGSASVGWYLLPSVLLAAFAGLVAPDRRAAKA